MGITPELVTYWQSVCIPYIKENWNYYKAIPRFEEQSVALYELRQDPNKENLWEKFDDVEKINLLGHYIHWKEIGSYVKPEFLRSLIISINAEIGEIKAIKDQSPESSTYIDQRINAFLKLEQGVRTKDNLKEVLRLSNVALNMWAKWHYTADALQISKLSDEQINSFEALPWMPKTLENLHEFLKFSAEEIAHLNQMYAALPSKLKYYSMLTNFKTAPEILKTMSMVTNEQVKAFEALHWMPKTLENLHEFLKLSADEIAHLNQMYTALPENLKRVYDPMLKNFKTAPEILKTMSMLTDAQVAVFIDLDSSARTVENLKEVSEITLSDTQASAFRRFYSKTLKHLKEVSKIELSDAQGAAFDMFRGSSGTLEKLQEVSKIKLSVVQARAFRSLYSSDQS